MLEEVENCLWGFYVCLFTKKLEFLTWGALFVFLFCEEITQNSIPAL